MRQRQAGAAAPEPLRLAVGTADPRVQVNRNAGVGEQGTATRRSAPRNCGGQLTVGVAWRAQIALTLIAHCRETTQGMQALPPDFSSLQPHTHRHHRAREMTSFITSLVPP